MKTNREQLGMLIGEVYRLWRSRLDEQLLPMGLSQSRWQVLLHLDYRGDGVVQKTLADWLGIEGPSLVRLLDRMTADGWIERRDSDCDRRAKTVHLTHKAQQAIGDIRRIATRLRNELLKGVSSEEIDTCFRVLQTIKQQAERS